MTDEERNSILVYEHKCRKCGKITEMFYSERGDKEQWLRFSNHLHDMVIEPRCEECEVCKRWTVHEIISYSGPFLT